MSSDFFNKGPVTGTVLFGILLFIVIPLSVSAASAADITTDRPNINRGHIEFRCNAEFVSQTGFTSMKDGALFGSAFTAKGGFMGDTFTGSGIYENYQTYGGSADNRILLTRDVTTISITLEASGNSIFSFTDTEQSEDHSRLNTIRTADLQMNGGNIPLLVKRCGRYEYRINGIAACHAVNSLQWLRGEDKWAVDHWVNTTTEVLKSCTCNENSSIALYLWIKGEEKYVDLSCDELSVSLGFSPPQPKPGDAMDFIAVATYPAGVIPTFEWSLDGGLLPGKESRIHYENVPEGVHTVTVRVTDGKGGSAKANATFIARQNRPPTVSLSYSPQFPTADDTITFTASGSDPDQDTLTFRWYIDEKYVGETQGTLEEKIPEGPHNIRVEASDGRGGIGEARVPLTITAGKTSEVTKNHPPTVTIKYTPEYPQPGDSIELTAEGYDADNDPLTYRWVDLIGNINWGGEDPVDKVIGLQAQKPVERTCMHVKVFVYDGKGEDSKGEDIAFIIITKRVQLPQLHILDGTVTVDGRTIAKGAPWTLTKQNRIATSPSSHAKIQYPDGTEVWLQPGTELEIDDQGKAVTIHTGTILQKIKRLFYEESFTATPNSVAGIRGTAFEVSVGEDGSSSFLILEGSVDISDTARRKNVTATAGESVLCTANGMLGNPTSYDRSSLDVWWGREPWIDPGQKFTLIPEGPALTFESAARPAKTSVQIPLTLTGISKGIGNMDLSLRYDRSVLEASEVLKGGLTERSLFDSNIQGETIRISIADREGFSGDGAVAYIRFNVIGSEGSTSPLTISTLAANRAEDLAALTIPTQNGVFTVISTTEARGDGSGDREVTALDALMALQMAVGKRAEDLTLDMDSNGKITSLDARLILKQAVE